MNRQLAWIGAILGWSLGVPAGWSQTAAPAVSFQSSLQSIRVEATPEAAGAQESRAQESRAQETTLAGQAPSPQTLRPLVPATPTFDPAVQPVSYEAVLSADPVFSNGLPATRSAAEQMVQLVDQRPAGQAGTGAALSLQEALRSAPSAQRLAVTRAYWNCFEARAQVETRRYLASLVQQLSSAGGVDQSVLRSEQALAGSEISDAEGSLRDAQLQLQRLLPALPQRGLPLPTSLPLVSEYVTNYDSLAARRPPDPRLQGIDLRLVESLASLTALADATWEQRESMSRLITACNQRQQPLSEAMYAVQVCQRAHDAFYRTVVRYNQDIAAYAFAVAPPGLSADQAVTMLIKVPAAPDGNQLRQADATSVLNSGIAPQGMNPLTVSGAPARSPSGQAQLPAIQNGNALAAQPESTSRTTPTVSNTGWPNDSMRSTPTFTPPPTGNPSTANTPAGPAALGSNSNNAQSLSTLLGSGTAGSGSATAPTGTGGAGPPIVRSGNSGINPSPAVVPGTSGNSSNLPPPTQFQLGNSGGTGTPPPPAPANSISLGNPPSGSGTSSPAAPANPPNSNFPLNRR